MKSSNKLTLAAALAFAAIAVGCSGGDNGTDIVDGDVAGDVSQDVGSDIGNEVAADAADDVPVVKTGYSAGWGVTDVSGVTGTMMGGYGFCMNAPDSCRYAEGVHDPLLARAIAVRDNASGEAVILITVDVVGILRYDIDLIHAAAPARFKEAFGIDGFDGRRIVMTASHTHHSTDTMGLWGPLDGSGRDEEYATHMREQVLEAAVAAWADLKPVNIFYTGTGSAPNYDKDKWSDDQVIQTLRFADRETGKTRFTLTRWSAHVTNYPQQLQAFSAGHHGTFSKAMEELTGAPAALFQGAIGSVYSEGYMFDEPGQPACQMDDMFADGYQDPDLRPEFISAVTCMGSGLAKRAFAAIQDEVAVPETGVKNRFHKFAFHPETKYPVMFDWTMFSYVEMGPLHFEVPPADQIDNPESTMDTQFNWVTIGDVNLITTPGEAFPLFADQIRHVLSRSSDKNIVLGLGQDWLGYIPAWQQWQVEDDAIVYNKALAGGQYLPKRYLEELQTLVTTETGLPADCTGDIKKCSDDGNQIMECVGGIWIVNTDCFADFGQICDDTLDGGDGIGCVNRWAWHQPVWSTCEDNLLATPESLVSKAAYYDDIAMRLHFHPQLKWIAPVTLPKSEVECPQDVAGPCYAPTVPEATATWEDVEYWHTGENDGLWSALYLASQAFRYGATKDPVALENIRKLMEGEKWRMEITGVPGLFTRQYIPKDVAGIQCPTDLHEYIPDDIKDDNKWLRVGDDGCIYTVDGGTMEWVKQEVCGLDNYAGWCLLDNVSQDEYAGHMFALGAIYKLVDDATIKADAAKLLGQVGRHLADNWMHFIDWDGRDTEHGKMNIYSFADSPGFLAVHSLGFMLMAAEATNNQRLWDFFDKCLLQKDGGPCEGWPYPEPPYDTEISNMLLYNGPLGCKANYNNFSMVFAAIHNLAWFLKDAGLMATVQDTFENHFMDDGNQPRALTVQKNPWFNFGFAAMKKLGPENPQAFELVEDGICSLREFQASQAQRFGNSAENYAEFCESRFEGRFMAENPIPIPERCTSTFEWWGDPYQLETCTAAPWNIQVPTGYLLPYWMGRYYGFISQDI